MPLTFYTVLLQPGYPVKYCEPHNQQDARSYGRVQTFGEKDDSFDDPAEASQEFQAWKGSQQVCYLDPGPFQAKVKALHRLGRVTFHEREREA